MSFLYTLLIGFFAGWIVGWLTRGKGYGIFGNIIVGIIGSWIGGFVFGLTGLAATNTLGSILMSVIGALTFLFILRLIKPTRSSRSKEKDE